MNAPHWRHLVQRSAAITAPRRAGPAGAAAPGPGMPGTVAGGICGVAACCRCSATLLPLPRPADRGDGRLGLLVQLVVLAHLGGEALPQLRLARRGVGRPPEE